MLILFKQNINQKKSHPLKVEEVFLKGLSGLSLLALVDYIRVFFVATALVVFTAVSLPITKTHPAEICEKNTKILMASQCMQNKH